MAHKKAGGSKAGQGGNVKGKRLGVKKIGGASVKAGEIILRQRGQTIIPGDNVGMGKDYTIFAKVEGIVKFIRVQRSGDRKKVSVVTKAESSK